MTKKAALLSTLYTRTVVIKKKQTACWFLLTLDVVFIIIAILSNSALTKSGCALEEIFMNVIKSPYAEPRKTPVHKLCLGKNWQLNNVKNKVCQKFFLFQKCGTN